MRRTTLVLGAGASRPFGFPTAAELREIIVYKKPDLVSTILAELGAPARLWDVVTHEMINSYGRENLQQLQNEFFHSQTTSIDRFVQERGGLFDELGRQTLAHILLRCEGSAYLNRNWYGTLRDALFQKGHDHLPTDRIQIVTFNYDRSLERYMWNALRYTYGLQEGLAFDLMESLKIYHVYGSLGNLRKGDRGPIVGWGATTAQQVIDAAQQLHLVRPLSEGLPSETREFIRSSDVVCFLGFGFWKENFELVAKCVGPDTAIYSSGRGLTNRLRDEVSSRFPKIKWGERWSAEQCLHEWNILP
jgi:hypothetical protein